MKRTELQQLIYDTIKEKVENVWYDPNSMSTVSEQVNEIYDAIMPYIEENNSKTDTFMTTALLGVLFGAVVGFILGLILIMQPLS